MELRNRKVSLCLDRTWSLCKGENLSLWNRNGEHLHTVQNCAIEDIHSMISIQNERIVAAADKELVSYELSQSGDSSYKLAKVKQMQYHSEAIHSLVLISASTFASGSVDGMIIIWTTSNLQPIKRLNPVSTSEGDNKRFPNSVQALMCVQERYLLAAIGCGFYAFDVSNDKEILVLQKKTAHLSKITCIGFACEGELLATCSEDKCLRLWGQKQTAGEWKDMVVTTMEKFSGLQSNELLQLSASSPWEPSLLGECCAHGGSVQGFLDFDHEGIVTCGSDGLVIIWKNSEMQKVRRNQAVRKLLLNCDGIV
uniref:Anaphase-promoting complex subunit 4 WD40 domain-containing protein n=1 Tax=Arion vulgaris TaxID=1028688 RepID=A0A0B7B7P2_9EUPU